MAVRDMDRRREQALPALVSLYGGADKKPWPLNRDIATLGRAKGCDIVLEAPDVSSLHCLVWAFQGGYQVRDCGSRAGTQLNGDRITEATLHDGDILQVGPFSFRLALPTGPKNGPSRREERSKHLERSRRKLAQLALAQRKKLQTLQQAMLGDSGPAQLDLNQKISGFRRRYRDFEQRLRKLEQEERDLSKDREAFDQERKEQLARMTQAEQELHRRCHQVHTHLEARRHEMLAQEKSMTETRQTESEIAAQLEQQRQAQEQAEKSLREQRAELVRMMADLRHMHETIRSQKNVNVQALQEENDRLRSQLGQSAAGAPAEDSSQLRQEIKELQEENLRLRQLLQEQRELLEELKKTQAPQAPPRENVDLDHYEAELNAYRQQLETDRQKLDEEMQQLKVRNQELDEATREMEMDFSRERAELARERTRLERLKEEVRVETERLQRDHGVRESLVSVQRLRDGFSPKH
jgi:pSer/pThr/pTyr-binding forkhead associated (FHA) protein